MRSWVARDKFDSRCCTAVYFPYKIIVKNHVNNKSSKLNLENKVFVNKRIYEIAAVQSNSHHN